MAKQYCLSDLHGRYDILTKVLDMLGPDDTLYFLGDAADRGPDGAKCIEALLNDYRVKYILGNHEQMLMDAVEEFVRDPDSRQFYDAYNLLCYNGGEKTFEDMIGNDNVADMFIKLDKLPYYTRLVRHTGETILLTHSGYEIENFDDVWPDEKEYALWDRNHYHGYFTPEKFDYIIHGHTPIELMVEDINKTREFCGEEPLPAWDGTAYKYAGGRKINIDGGAYFHGQAILLDLDDFSSIIIKGE